MTGSHQHSQTAPSRDLGYGWLDCPPGSVVIMLTLSQGRAGVQQREICPVQKCWRAAQECNTEKSEVMVEGELSPDTPSDLVELIEKNAEGF